MDQIGRDILGGLVDAVVDLAMTVWAFISANTLGFVTTGTLIGVVLCILLIVYFKYGFKALVAFAIAALAIFELQRRSAAEPKPSKQWPEAMPEDKPKTRTIFTRKGRRN